MIPIRMVAALAGAWMVAASAADAGSLELVRSYTVQGNFVSDDGHIARDLSGFACMPQPARRCLAINDENRAAQFATLDDGRITPESPSIKLIGDSFSAMTLGKEPDINTCPGKKEFKDLDGEAVAYAAPYFYAVGSHG